MTTAGPRDEPTHRASAVSVSVRVNVAPSIVQVIETLKPGSNRFPVLSADDGEAAPGRTQRPAIGAGYDFVGAIGRGQHPAVRHLEVRRAGRNGLFHGRRESGKAMRRRQIVGDAGPGAARDRQREAQRTLAHQPHAGGTIAAAEELESRHGRQVWLRRERGDVLGREHAHQRVLRPSAPCRRTRRSAATHVLS